VSPARTSGSGVLRNRRFPTFWGLLGVAHLGFAQRVARRQPRLSAPPVRLRVPRPARRRCAAAIGALRCRSHERGFGPHHRCRLLCVAFLALLGMLWAALHFGAGDDDDLPTAPPLAGRPPRSRRRASDPRRRLDPDSAVMSGSASRGHGSNYESDVMGNNGSRQQECAMTAVSHEVLRGGGRPEGAPCPPCA